MPTPDFGPGSSLARLRAAQRAAFMRSLSGIERKRRRPDDRSGETLPVRPDRPLDLSGGATATLEFDC